jgi:hypothetical protein
MLEEPWSKLHAKVRFGCGAKNRILVPCLVCFWLRGYRRIACLSNRRDNHFTPAREMRRDVRALTVRNHPEGRYYPLKRHALIPRGWGIEDVCANQIVRTRSSSWLEPFSVRTWLNPFEVFPPRSPAAYWVKSHTLYPILKNMRAIQG